MTAEVAILNKSAVSLATDSAVTIGKGNSVDGVKVYDSADKLFEVSNAEPVALMLYNGMDFAEIPFAVLIKSFRDTCADFESVEQYGDEFLKFLNERAKKSSDPVKERILQRLVVPLLDEIGHHFRERVFQGCFRECQYRD